MKEKALIFLTIILVLIFSFSFSYYFLFVTQDTIEIQKKLFYQNIADEKKSKFFLIGSSHFMPINPEKIEEIISENNEYAVFNIAEAGDNPKTRIRQLDHIIMSNPDLIIYGLGYSDFSEKSRSDSLLPDPKQIIEKNIHLDIPHFLDNPKFQTLSIFRNILSIQESGFFGKKTPFFEHDEYLFNVVSNKQLDRIQETDILIPIKEKNQSFQDFKSMMYKFNENGIRVIIILTPLRDIWIDKISEQNKQNFNLIIDDIEKSSDIVVYSLIKNYTDHKIWRDNEHITNNEIGLEYTYDIAKIILKEI